jgi:predicted DsbA family dithiol-disulfide isomerase
MTLTIDVVSDVVCPWCYVGKRHLEAALKLRPDLASEVRFRPFQLDPTIPQGGVDRTEYMVKKFVSLDRIHDAHTRLEEMGAKVGIQFAFDKITRAPNTLDAHRLIRWSYVAGTQSAVKERLMSLYFEHGVDIGDRDVLLEVAGQNGLETDIIAKLLEDGSDIEEVQAEIRQAQELGISGVPFFILAGKLGLSGAQPVEVMLQGLDQAVTA